ncbi:PREDICTED: UDP-glycosyltransferase 74E2-like [Ipomoea nil]|uniref:UDP-glycosyltransferase 74E2-like n=1 Tax=Ipomoea nil TaxID=35883 RepID=UPI000901D738|nr:PREDICTED: UDP-glycosyltransferase 74E2-like [Ipomoea nil]
MHTVYHHTDQENLTAPTEGSTVSLPSMPPLGLKDLPSFVRNKSSYSSLLRFVLSRNLNTQKADWLLFNTFDELEKEFNFGLLGLISTFTIRDKLKKRDLYTIFPKYP